MSVRRPDLVIAAAIAVCLPMLPSFLSGAIGPASALVRLAIALFICWIAAAIVQRVLDTYSAQARQAEIRRAIEHARALRDGTAHVPSMTPPGPTPNGPSPR